MFSCCELARYFDAMPMGVCVIGADGKGLYSNQAAIHILGRPMEARPESGALGRVCGFFLAGTDKVYPVEKTPFYLIVHKGLASHTIADMEVEHPGGRRVLVEIAASAVTDDQGALVQVMTIVRDITDRSRQEDDKRRASLLNMAGALFSNTVDGDLALAHLADIVVPGFADFCRVFVLESGKFRALGDEAGRGQPHVQEAELRRVVALGASELHSRPVVEPGEGTAQSRMLVAVPGASGCLGAILFLNMTPGRRYSAEDLRMAEQLAGMAGRFIENVRAYQEALKEAEERKRDHERAHILTAAGAILASSLDFEVTLRNVSEILVPDWADWCSISFLQSDGALHNLVFKHNDPQRNLAVRDLHPHYPLIEEPAGEARVAHRGEAIFEPRVSEESLRRRSLDPVHLERLRWIGMESVVVVPILSKAAKPLGVMKLVYTQASNRFYSEADLEHARKLAEMAGRAIENAMSYRQSRRESEERRRAQEHTLRQSEMLKKAFVSRVSHELRTPLTSIKGSLALLTQGVVDGAAKEGQDLLHMAERNTSRVIQLVNDILDIERMANGHVELEVGDCEVAALLRSAEEVVAGLAREHRVRLRIGETREYIRVDGKRLVQVLTNLLSNAIKFSRAGGEVVVSCGLAQGWVEIFVQDWGLGIPAEEQALIFEPFYQGESGHTTHIGTGLGLAISKGIVEQHGGEIGVTSQPGQGSTFRLRFPWHGVGPLHRSRYSGRPARGR